VRAPVTRYGRYDALSDADLLLFVKVHGIGESPDATGLALAVSVHKADPIYSASLLPLKYAPMFLLFRFLGTGPSPGPPGETTLYQMAT
jgi:hypothetical protein